jgi:uncharacterized RDD family membrane protein YckC
VSGHEDHDEHREITVETLRTPPLNIRPAPVLKRAVAALMDSIIVVIASGGLLLGLQRRIAVQPMVDLAYLGIVTFLYYFLQEGFLAVTLGKKVLGLRIVREDGDPITLRDSFIRNVLRFIDWLPSFYILGATAMAFSSKRRRIGDRFAHTVVTLATARDINPPPAPFLFH